MALKILVTGDLHIGKRSSSLPPDDFRASTRYTWEKIVQYALANRVDLVLLTGDIVDRDNRFYEAVGPLQSGFAQLSQADISIYMVAGNHDFDVLPQIIALNNAGNIRLLGGDGKWESSLFSKNGETIRLIGWSFAERYIHNDATLDMEPDVMDSKCPTLALIHGDVYSATSRYNPLQIGKLKNIQGVDAWLLGHIHRPDVLCHSEPLIFYPGSPHALSSKEQDIHGPYMLTVENNTINYKQTPFSPVCYRTVCIDVSEITDEFSFRSTVISSLRGYTAQIKETYTPDYLVFDIDFTGSYKNPGELRKWSDDIRNYGFGDDCRIIIRTIEYNVRPPLEIEHLMGDPSYTGVLAAAIRTLETGDSSEFVDKLTQEWINRYKQTVSLPVYAPLHIEMNERELRNMAREYILTECREIIGELNMQRNED